MPKVNLSRCAKRKAPPIDDGWGAILVRKEQLGVSLKDIADGAGVNYGSLRHFWGKPPIMWKHETRSKILEFLGLEAELRIKEREI